MISKTDKVLFLKTFGCHFSTMDHPIYGFDLFNFEKWYAPETEGLSMREVVEMRYGIAVRELIEKILEPKSPNYPDNSACQGLVNTHSEYLESMMVGIEIVGHKTTQGLVTWPFALRQDNKKWKVDHLPTGCFIMQNLSKAKAKRLLALLIADFSEALANSDYLQETYDSLSAIVNEFR